MAIAPTAADRVWMSHYCRQVRSGMSDNFSGIDLLKRDFTVSGGDDTDALARLESGVFEPVSAEADFRLDTV